MEYCDEYKNARSWDQKFLYFDWAYGAKAVWSLRFSIKHRIATDGIILRVLDPIKLEAAVTTAVAAGLIADGAIVLTFDPLNPHAQYQQHICLRDEVLMDKRVELETDEDIVEFSDALETVLNKFDPETGVLKASFYKLGACSSQFD